MVPIWQLMFGVCAGVIAFLVLRPRLQEGHHSTDDARTNNCSDGPQTGRLYNSEPGDICVICLEAMQNENMTYMRCGHALHDGCYNNCKLHTKKCPLCLANM